MQSKLLFEKPTILNRNEVVTKVYLLLSSGQKQTRSQLIVELGWPLTKTSDRRVRDIIAEIAWAHPVISTSNQKGYRIALPTDLEDCEHEYKEILSRIKQMAKRLKPLREIIRLKK
jgi:hypothetical protein